MSVGNDPTRPLRRRKSKVAVRDLDKGVPVEANYFHTSFRLDDVRRKKLRRIARVLHGGVTMSGAFRSLIDDRYREMFEAEEKAK